MISYNSIFSQSWARQAYVTASASHEDVIELGSFDAGWFERRYSRRRHLLEDIQANNSKYEKLDVLECVRAYDKKALLDRKHVMVGTTTPQQQVNSRSSQKWNATLSDERTNPLYAVEGEESIFALGLHRRGCALVLRNTTIRKRLQEAKNGIPRTAM